MNRRILIAFGVVALAVVAFSTDTNAQCSPTKDFNLAFGTGTGNVQALVFPADANQQILGGVVKGRFWQAGARSAANEGTTCPEDAYLLSFDPPEPNRLTIYGQSGGGFGGTPCINSGCVGGEQVMLIQTLSTDGTKSYYAVGTSNEITGEFEFGRGAVDWPLVETPRPRVTASSRVGSVVTTNLVFDPPAGARGEANGKAPQAILTGYQLVLFQGTGDPGRAAGLWTNLGTVIPVTATGATVSGIAVTCSSTSTDAFIATRPVYDNGQFSGDYVSASTRIECDPTLADPRFKNIDKSKSGRGATVRQN